MKGGILNRLRGKQISLIFSVLAGATIIFCAWERGPTVSTLLSAHDQFLMSTSAIFRVGPDRSTSKKSKEEKKEILSHPLITGEGKNDHTKQDIYAVPIGSPTMSTSTRTKNDGDLTTSSSVNQHTKKDVYAVPIGSPTMSTSTRTKNDSDLTTSSSVNQSTKKDIYAVPIGSPTMNTSARTKNDSDLTTSSSVNQDCNYAKGKWITDNRRPLYSGFGCKQWLSGMWACRLNQRPNFSYEGFRWQPKNCEMPEFNSSTFLRKMQDKTIAFIGDSLGRQQFQSLMCMVTDGEYTTEVENVGWQYGLVKARGAIRPDGWAYRFPSTNTTILYYWSATLCNLEPLNLTNPATEYALHLDRPATFLSHYLHRFDILVLNTGHHWNRGKFSANRWVMYVNGTPNSSEKLADFGNAKNFAVYNVVMWVDSQLSQHPKLQPFFRTISPRHFFNGDWNTGGTCDNTSPSGGSEVLKDESSDPVVEDAVKGQGVKILDITAISQLRDEAHISRYSIRPTEGMQDCLHWCLPGIPDTWNELLVAQI